MKVKNAVAYVFLFFLIVRTGAALGQEEKVFNDSISFVNFLKSQGEIPGVSYRLLDSSQVANLDTAGLGGLPVDLNTRFDSTLLLKNTLLASDSSDLKIQFLIYNDPNTFEATQEYVSNLLRNGDIEPVSSDFSSGKDLISLASRVRYTPKFYGANAYFGDLKMFAISIIIATFCIFSFSMILFMIIFKARRNRREMLLQTHDEEVVIPLSEILFEKTLEEIESLTNEELHLYFPEKQLKKPLYRQVLVERILALNKKMKGDFKLKLKALYKRLGLDKATVEKLNSSKWDKVVTGLVEVNEMDLTETLKVVRNLINSPNFHIRSQAVATLLNLSDNVDLAFLRDQAFPLSRWQQMNYLRIIKYLHASRSLHIENLFDSKNQSIRLFGYKLVRVIGRIDLLAILEDRFASVTDEEKIEIIKTFEYLGAPPHTELINGSLQSDNIDLVTMAAKAVGVIGDETSIEIICRLLKNDPGFKLQMTLLKSLQSLDSAQYNQFVKDNSFEGLQRINLHLSDPLLQDV